MRNNGLNGCCFRFRATILHTLGVWVGFRVSCTYCSALVKMCFSKISCCAESLPNIQETPYMGFHDYGDPKIDPQMLYTL